MKTTCSVHWHFESSRYTVTRERASYLLRAARSRRWRNIERRGPGNYRLKDCSLTVYTR